MSKEEESSSGNTDNQSSTTTSDNSDSQQPGRRRVATSKRTTKKNKRRTVKSRAKKKRKSTYRKRATVTRRSKNKKKRSRRKSQSAIKLSQTQINILTSEIRRSFEKLSSIMAKKKRRVKRKSSRMNMKKRSGMQSSSESIDIGTATSSVSSSNMAQPYQSVSPIIESQDTKQKVSGYPETCKTLKFKVETPPFRPKLANIEAGNKLLLHPSKSEEYPNGCYKVVRVRTDPPYGIKENSRNEKMIAPIAEVLPTPKEIAEQKRCISRNGLQDQAQKSPFWKMLHSKVITPKTGPPQRLKKESPPKVPKTLPFETCDEGGKSLKKVMKKVDGQAKSKVLFSPIPPVAPFPKSISIVNFSKQKSEHSLASLDPQSSSSSEVILIPPDSSSESDVKAKAQPVPPPPGALKKQPPQPCAPAKDLPIKKQLPLVENLNLVKKPTTAKAETKSGSPLPPKTLKKQFLGQANLGKTSPSSEKKMDKLAAKSKAQPSPKAKEVLEAKLPKTVRSDLILAKRKLEDFMSSKKKAIQDKMQKADQAKKVSVTKFAVKYQAQPPPLPTPPKKSSLVPPPPPPPPKTTVRPKEPAKVEAPKSEIESKRSSSIVKSTSDPIQKEPSSEQSLSSASMDLRSAKSSSIQSVPSRDQSKSKSDPKMKAKPKTLASVPPKTLKQQSSGQASLESRSSSSEKKMDKMVVAKPKAQPSPEISAKKTIPIQDKQKSTGSLSSTGSVECATSSSGKIKVPTIHQPKMDSDSKLVEILKAQPPSPPKRKHPSAAGINSKSEAKKIDEPEVPKNASSDPVAAGQDSTESLAKSCLEQPSSSSELNAMNQPELESNSELTLDTENATDSSCSA